MTINDETQIIFIHVPKCAGSSLVTLSCFEQSKKEEVGIGHAKIREIMNVRKEKAKKYLKIAVVREPVSRLLSAYAFLKSGGMKTAGDLEYKNIIDQYKDFDDFVKHLLKHDLIHRIIHLVPMHEFTCLENGKLAMDVVFQYENLQCLQVYLTSKKLLKPNESIPWHNKTIMQKSEASTESVHAIHCIYKKDYELFYPEQLSEGSNIQSLSK